MLMEIYRDTTGLFTTKECDDDNVMLMEFDDDVIAEFFRIHYASEGKEFDEWLAEYTCDEVDGLYDFAVAMGKKPTVV